MKNLIKTLYVIFCALLCFSVYSMDHEIGINIRTCGILSSKHLMMEGELSDYWAQNLIGSDLLREELEGLPAPSPKAKFISVFESLTRGNQFNEHAFHVRNLISNEGPHAVLPELEDNISISIQGLQENYNRLFFQDAFAQLRAESPSFINHSMYWGPDDEGISFYEGFKDLSHSAIVVVASGNLFPEPLAQKSQASKDFNAILVGSLSPSGLVSDFSQEGEEVHILAPSDHFITSENSNREYSLFGGASGAAPLVTGTLAGFEWISGYHPTAEEAKILLEKTAIPTLHSHDIPRLNGAGVLNSYKISRLAVRLRDRCQSELEANAVDCFAKEIRREENYLFPTDETLGVDLARAFPLCSFEPTQIENVAMSCKEKAKLFKRLRKEHLLSPNRRELLESLSCIYKEAGFNQNALMMDHLALAFDPSLNSALNHLSLLVKHTRQPDYKKIVARLARNWGAQGINLLQQLSQDTNYNVRIAVAKAAVDVGGEPGAHLLQQLIPDEAYQVRLTVAKSAGQIGGAPGAHLLQQLIPDEHFLVRFNVAKSAGQIGGAPGAHLLQQLITDEAYPVRLAVTESAGQIGGALGAHLLRQLTQDKDPEISSTARLLLALIPPNFLNE